MLFNLTFNLNSLIKQLENFLCEQFGLLKKNYNDVYFILIPSYT